MQTQAQKRQIQPIGIELPPVGKLCSRHQFGVRCAKRELPGFINRLKEAAHKSETAKNTKWESFVEYSKLQIQGNYSEIEKLKRLKSIEDIAIVILLFTIVIILMWKYVTGLLGPENQVDPYGVWINIFPILVNAIAIVLHGAFYKKIGTFLMLLDLIQKAEKITAISFVAEFALGMPYMTVESAKKCHETACKRREILPNSKALQKFNVLNDGKISRKSSKTEYSELKTIVEVSEEVSEEELDD